MASYFATLPQQLCLLVAKYVGPGQIYLLLAIDDLPFTFESFARQYIHHILRISRELKPISVSANSAISIFSPYYSRRFTDESTGALNWVAALRFIIDYYGNTYKQLKPIEQVHFIWCLRINSDDIRQILMQFADADGMICRNRINEFLDILYLIKKRVLDHDDHDTTMAMQKLTDYLDQIATLGKDSSIMRRLDSESAPNDILKSIRTDDVDQLLQIGTTLGLTYEPYSHKLMHKVLSIADEYNDIVAVAYNPTAAAIVTSLRQPIMEWTDFQLPIAVIIQHDAIDILKHFWTPADKSTLWYHYHLASVEYAYRCRQYLADKIMQLRPIPHLLDDIFWTNQPEILSHIADLQQATQTWFEPNNIRQMLTKTTSIYGSSIEGGSEFVNLRPCPIDATICGDEPVVILPRLLNLETGQKSVQIVTDIMKLIVSSLRNYTFDQIMEVFKFKQFDHFTPIADCNNLYIFIKLLQTIELSDQAKLLETMHKLLATTTEHPCAIQQYLLRRPTTVTSFAPFKSLAFGGKVCKNYWVLSVIGNDINRWFGELFCNVGNVDTDIGVKITYTDQYNCNVAIGPRDTQRLLHIHSPSKYYVFSPLAITIHDRFGSAVILAGQSANIDMHFPTDDDVAYKAAFISFTIYEY